MIKIVETKDYNLLAEMNQEVQLLHHKLYPDVFKPYDKSEIARFFEKELAKETTKAFIAMDGESCLGYMLLFIHRFDENPFQYKRNYLILDQILVKENVRSKGIGKLLLNEAFSFAQSNQINVVELSHWTLNETARLFFIKNGFSSNKITMSKTF